MAEKKQYSQLQFGLDIRTISPVDRRLVLSYEEMSTGIYNQPDAASGKDVVLGNILPEYYIVLCKGFDDNTHPLYPVLNEKFQGKLFVYEKDPRVPWNDSVDNEFYYRVKDELSGGIYTLLSYTIDIVGPDGGSLTDHDRGLVTIHDPSGSRIAKAESDIDEIFTYIDTMNPGTGSIGDRVEPKVGEQKVEEVVDDKLKKYQKFMPIYGDGDELDDSEGVPHRRPGANGFGVHVEYEPVTGKPWKTQAKISHEAVVPAGGWLSKYDIGGVAAGQAFMEGTSIEEVLRQLFCGDPKMDNVICFAMDSRKPTALNVWTDFHWLQEPTKRDVLLTSGIDHEYNPSNQFILMALPIAMIDQHGADYDTEWPIVLKELYNKDAPMFTYPFTYVDVKINATAADIGYRIYFLVGDDPVSGPQNIHFEFMENPDYPRP